MESSIGSLILEQIYFQTTKAKLFFPFLLFIFLTLCDEIRCCHYLNCSPDFFPFLSVSLHFCLLAYVNCLSRLQLPVFPGNYMTMALPIGENDQETTNTITNHTS